MFQQNVPCFQDEVPDPEAAGESGNESDDFIVGENGEPIRSERKKKKKHFFADEDRQLAEDIFGVKFDYGEFEQYGDEEDIEDDYDEEDDEMDGGEARARKKKRKTKTIFELYEPSELERRHFTDADNEIRNTDVPERMQLRSVPVTAPEDPDELDREAEWIFNKFTKRTISKQELYESREIDRWNRDKEQVIEKIRNALFNIRTETFEVPFIAFYRKEYVNPQLKINDLWRVYYFDEEWCKLVSRKKSLKKLYERCKAYQEEQIIELSRENPDADLPSDVRRVTDEDIEAVDSVTTVEELKDLEQLFKLYYSRDRNGIQEMVLRKRKDERERRKEERLLRKINKKTKKRKTKTITNEEGEEVEVTDDEAQDEDDEEEEEEEESEPEEDPPEEEVLKQAHGNDPYSFCRKYGIAEMANHFGLKPWEFGENLQDCYQKIDVDQSPLEPLRLAEEFATKSPKLSPDQAGDVLNHVKQLVAFQLARDPKVRGVVREAFFERAKLTVRPTKKGMKEIDENHDCYAMKYLTDKPVNSLEYDQWLKLVEAEKQKMITIDLGKEIESFPKGKTYLSEAQEYYRQDAFSKSVQEWNDLRKECVENAFTKILYPMLRVELRNKLTREAKDAVLHQIKAKVFNWLKVGKYNVNFDDEDEDEWGSQEGCRIMAVMYENDLEVSAYAVMISTDGEVLGYLKLDHLLKRKNSWNESEREAKESDLALIKKFISTRRPHCIVVGAADRAAIGIKEDLEYCVQGRLLWF